VIVGAPRDPAAVLDSALRFVPYRAAVVYVCVGPVEVVDAVHVSPTASARVPCVAVTEPGGFAVPGVAPVS
jgi:hypothetical protein